MPLGSHIEQTSKTWRIFFSWNIPKFATRVIQVLSISEYFWTFIQQQRTNKMAVLSRQQTMAVSKHRMTQCDRFTSVCMRACLLHSTSVTLFNVSALSVQAIGNISSHILSVNTKPRKKRINSTAHSRTLLNTANSSTASHTKRCNREYNGYI